jgi:hypothetical protein
MRCDALQEHVSWPFNPKTRALFSLYAGKDGSNYLLPYWTPHSADALPCLFSIPSSRRMNAHAVVPAGFLFLLCKHNHYEDIHDRVKLAIAAKIRSFVSAEVAPTSLMVDQPIDAQFGPRNPAEPPNCSLVADLIVLLYSDLQQRVFFNL